LFFNIFINFFLGLQEKSYKKEANEPWRLDRLCKPFAFSEDKFIKIKPRAQQSSRTPILADSPLFL
jgi:hypothetical protein